jgi:hypothetical protein
MLPNDVVNIIAQFEPKIFLSIFPKYKISKKQQTYEFFRYCVINNHFEYVKYLIASDIKLTSDEYDNCFEIAIFNHNTNIINILISKVNINSCEFKSCIKTLIYSNNVNLINLLLSHGLIVLDYMIKIAEISLLDNLVVELLNIKYGFV